MSKFAAVAGCYGIFVFLMFASSTLSAQGNGIVTGVITDNSYDQPLPGANVLVEGSSTGSSSNAEGRYLLKNVPTGEQTIVISYLGFNTRRFDITVKAGETVVLNVELEDNFLQMEGIKVEGFRQGQASALNQQKTAINIKNVVAADLIGRFPDQNVADALRRIPAISIQQDQGESRYIQIRGTNPNLSNITINGEQIPSPEGDVRFVALDMIPSDVLSSIEVNKAITPDMDGDAIGGSVNLNTLTAANRQVFKVTLAPGYNNQADFLSPFGGIASVTYGDRLLNDKLGFMVSSSYNRSNRASNNNEMEYDGTDIDELQLRDYELTRERWGSVASVDYQFNPLSRVYANMAFNYFSDTEYRRALILSSDKIERELKDRLERQKIFSLSLGGDHTLSSKWGVDYMGSYSYADQNTPFDRAGLFAQEFEDANGDAVDIISFDRTNTNYPQFVVTPEGNAAGAGAYNYSAFSFDEFEQSTEFTSDQNVTGRLNIKHNYQFGDLVGQLKFGGLIRNKQKETTPNVNLYGYDGSISGVDADFQFSDVQSNFEDTNFLNGNYPGGIGLFPDPESLEDYFNRNRAGFDADFQDEDSQADSRGETFSATENTYAGYMMTTLNLNKWNALVGARYEATQIDYNANIVEFDENGDLLPIRAAEGENDFGFLLPMIHLTYQVNPLVNVRAAWTNSFAKPNYFDLAPYRLINREDREIELGNPLLDPTFSMNFDLLGEYYFNSVGVISAGVFYKQLDNFIYISAFDFNEAGPYQDFLAIRPVNGGNADLAGFEFNLQQQLTFLPGFASGFGLFANYTYSWSNAEIINDSGSIVREVALPGQAENTGNLALSYERSGFTGRISMYYAGSFIDEIRDVASNDRIYDEHIQFDFSAMQRVTPNLTVFLELINITNEPLRYYNGVSNRPEQQEFYSFWGNLGVKFEL